MGVNRDSPVIVIDFPEARMSPSDMQTIRNRVLSFKFTDEESKMDKIELVLDNHDLLFFETPILRKGTLLAIRYGYAGKTAPARAMVVRKMKGGLTVTVEANSPSILMATKNVTRTGFVGRTYSEIVRDIAAANGFEAEFLHVQDTTERFEIVTQSNETDASFLARLAKRQGFEFWVDHTGLHWEERPLGKRPIRVIDYAGGLGDVIGEPRIESDILGLHGLVKVKARDPEKGKDVSGDASNKTDTTRYGLAEVTEMVDPETGKRSIVAKTDDSLLAGAATRYVDSLNLTGSARAAALQAANGRAFQSEVAEVDRLGLTGSARTAALLATMDQEMPELRVSGSTTTSGSDPATAGKDAKAKFRRGVRRAVKMGLDLVGDPILAAKQVVEVRGMKKRLNQRYYVKRAVHTIDSNGYRTSVDLISDGHGGHSTAGDSRLNLGGGKRKGGGTNPTTPNVPNEVLDKLDTLLATVQSRVAGQTKAVVPDPGMLSLLEHVQYARNEYASKGPNAAATADQAAKVALTKARVRKDDQLRNAAMDVVTAARRYPVEEQANLARHNRAEVVKNNEKLYTEEIVNPETGKKTYRYREP